ANAALQQRPEVLAAVRVDRAVHVGFGVVDDLVRVVGSQTSVGRERIGVDGGTGFDFGAHDVLHRTTPQRVDDVQTNPAGVIAFVPLHQTHHRDFPGEAASTLDDALAPSDVHVARLATDVGFVHFDFAGQLAATAVRVLHGEPDAVQHEPRGLLR